MTVSNARKAKLTGQQLMSDILHLHCNMALKLAPSKLHLIRDMIESQSPTTTEMAEEVENRLAGMKSQFVGTEPNHIFHSSAARSRS
jgi:hypothetical protein